MITAETMRRIAPKQGCDLTMYVLEFTAALIEERGMSYALAFVEAGTYRDTTESLRSMQPIFMHLLQIMRSPEVIDEWTPFGGEPNG